MEFSETVGLDLISGPGIRHDYSLLADRKDEKEKLQRAL